VQSSLTGVVYGVPSDAPDILRIDLDGSVSRFGDLGRCKNKWQNAVEGPDGRIYCVPCDAASVLCLDPTTDALSHIPLGDFACADQWQGAFLANDDTIIALPENAPAVLELRFADRRSPPALALRGATDPASAALAAAHRGAADPSSLRRPRRAPA